MPAVGSVERRWRDIAAGAADLVAVLAFVGIGRHAHDHGVSVGGMASTAWPFVAGMAVGWIVVRLRDRSLGDLSSGVPVWLATVAIGMVLRVVAGQGIAASFVGVALAFLGLLLVGWRVALFVGARSRSAAR